MAKLRHLIDVLHTRDDQLNQHQRKCKDLLRAISVVSLNGAGNVEGRDGKFMIKKGDALVAAEPRNWAQRVNALTLRLISMEGGERELEFVVNRWSKDDNREEVQAIWNHADMGGKHRMHCPFPVRVAGVTNKQVDAAYGRPLRSGPKNATKKVLVFILSRNIPTRTTKFSLAAADFKARGWVTDEEIEACRVKGEAEFQEHLTSGDGRRRERRGIRS